MQCPASGRLPNLLAATEAIGNDQRVWRGGADRRAAIRVRRSPARRRICPLQIRMRRPCRSIRSQGLSIEAPIFRSSDSSWLIFINRLVMAVSMKEHVPAKRRRLHTEAVRSRAVRKVEPSGCCNRCARASVGNRLRSSSRKHRRAARLEHHDRRRRLQCARQGRS